MCTFSGRNIGQIIILKRKRNQPLWMTLKEKNLQLCLCLGSVLINPGLASLQMSHLEAQLWGLAPWVLVLGSIYWLVGCTSVHLLSTFSLESFDFFITPGCKYVVVCAALEVIRACRLIWSDFQTVEQMAFLGRLWQALHILICLLAWFIPPCANVSVHENCELTTLLANFHSAFSTKIAESKVQPWCKRL